MASAEKASITLVPHAQDKAIAGEVALAVAQPEEGSLNRKEEEAEAGRQIAMMTTMTTTKLANQRERGAIPFPFPSLRLQSTFQARTILLPQERPWPLRRRTKIWTSIPRTS